MRAENYLDTLRVIMMFCATVVFPDTLSQYVKREFVYFFTIYLDSAEFWTRALTAIGFAALFCVIVGKSFMAQVCDMFSKGRAVTLDWVQKQVFWIQWESDSRTIQLKQQLAKAQHDLQLSNKKLNRVTGKLQKVTPIANNLERICSCPVGHEMMRSPLVMSCGHVFEMENALKLYNSMNNWSKNCPMCTKPYRPTISCAHSFIMDVLENVRKLADVMESD